MRKKWLCQLLGGHRKRKVLLVMKLCISLMLFFTLGLSASTLGQQERVNLDLKNVSIKVLFDEIQKQTNLFFVFNTEQTKSLGTFSVKAKDETVESVLNKVLENTGMVFEFDGKLIIVRPEPEKKVPEKVTVKGVVKDKRGELLPGVTIRVKGTALGFATNMKGEFSFDLPKRDTLELIFSFVGYKQRSVLVKDSEKSLSVVLEEDVQVMDEVVALGYYSVDKRHLTSAVTTLKMDDIMQPGISTVDQMLEGQVPGMIFMQNSGQVGATPKIKIRGTTTLLGSQAPLWVLDGMILTDPVNVDPADINSLDFVNLLGNAISGLNPDDIDKIDVLKDASATAIYGPQASNGVIVITTKKGKIGKPSISYSVSGTFRRAPRYTDRAVNVMNSQERIDYSREVVDGKQEVPTLSSWVGYEAAYSDYLSNKITRDEFISQVREMETVNTDWMGLLLQDTYSHAHSLSISGGTENIRYYASVGYTDEHGNTKGEENKRYTAMTRLNLNYNKFSMNFGLNASIMKKDYTPEQVGVADYAYNTARSLKAYNEDGTPWFYQRDYHGAYDRSFNILNEMKNSYNKINTDQISLNITLGYQVLKDLKADFTFSYGISHTDNNEYYGEDTWHILKLKNLYMETGEVNIPTSLAPFGGQLTLDNTKNENYSARTTLTYNRFLDEEQEHAFTANVIGELSSSTYNGFKITKRNYLPDRGNFFNPVGWSYSSNTQYTQYFMWTQTEEALGTLKDNLTRKVALIGSVSYAYKNSYILNGNIRIDASNAFGDASNDRLLPIWSASFRWNLDENLLKNVYWVNSLALKMSYGWQGNMSALGSHRLVIQKKGRNNFFGENYSLIDNYPNPNLKWERTSTYNIGLDFSLFNNKFNGNISYYYRYTKDAFFSKSISPVNGRDNYTVNQGNLRNQGYELTLNFVPINTMLNSASVSGERRGFIWRFDPNFGSVFNQLIDKIKPKDKVLQDEIKYTDYLSGNVQVAGRPVNTFYSYCFRGLNHDTGAPEFYGMDKYVEVNGESVRLGDIYKEMDREDVWMEVMEHSGCREPFLQGSISNYLGWRNWGLSFNLAYSIGSKIRLFKMYPNGGGVTSSEKNLRRELTERWQRPGDELHTNIPGILKGADWEAANRPWWFDYSAFKFAGNLWEVYDNSNLRVASGDYLKLSSCSLRYVVPEKICRKLYMQSAYLSVSGSNLFTICSKKLKGQDPSQSGSSSLINISVRPTYTLQLNVTF